jgi:excisionase family DNA binding protein
MLSEKWETVRQASEHSHMTSSYLIRLVERGVIAGEKIGSIYLINKASLAAYLATERRPGRKVEANA